MTTLGELADLTVGFVGTMTPHYRESGVPFLRSQNVRPHEVVSEDLKFIDPDFNLRQSKSSLRPGDVVIVRTGKPGTCAVIPEGFPEANCSDLVIVRPGPALNARWLSYFINAAAQGFVRSQAVGAVQQHFNVASAKQIPIPELSLRVQNSVAEVLGALDDKIAANRRVIAAADRLVESLVVSRLDQRRPLWGSIDFVFGEAFKGSEFSEPGLGRPLIRIRDLKSQRCQVWTTESRARERVVVPGEILVGMDAEFRATRWSGPQGVLNQRVLLAQSEKFGPAIVRHALAAPLAQIERSKTGTTVIHLNKSDLMSVEVSLPADDNVMELRSIADPIWLRMVACERENEALAKTRDELLPLLMSGKITVRDAEKRVEGVV